MRRFQSFKRERPKTPRPCIECGVVFMATKPKVCLCSMKCRTRNWRKLNPVPARYCVGCNIELTGSRCQLLCSGCRSKPRVRKHKICVICGSQVLAGGWKYCSDKCRSQISYKKPVNFPFALRAVLVAMIADDDVPGHYRKILANSLEKILGTKTEEQR